MIFEDLLKQYCSKGVDMIPLEELIHESTERNKKLLFSDIRSVSSQYGLISTDEFFENSPASNNTSAYKVVRPGMFAYNPARINIGSITFSTLQHPVLVSPMYNIFSINDSRITHEYLLLWIRSNKGMHEISTRVEVGARFRLPLSTLNKIRIPLPPIVVQKQITEKLQTIKNLINELEDDIELRKKQYVYYRNQLLDIEYEEGVEMKSLGEIACKITSGKNKSKSPEGPYPVFGSTGIIAYTETYLYDSPLILVARVGANAGYVHMSYGKYDVTDNTLIVELKKTVEQKYVYYVLIKEEINKFAKGGGQPLITSSILKHVMIPVPSLKKQQSIVKKLDAFTSLISKLQEERDLRQKQYEYYREKLLTFE